MTLTYPFTLRHRAMWHLCWIAYRIVMAMPGPDDLKSRYGKLYLWLISYAGAYAHSDRDTFYLCSFFYRSDAEQKAAWDRHIARPERGNKGAPPAQADERSNGMQGRLPRDSTSVTSNDRGATE